MDSATRENIKHWLDQGVRSGATHVIVVCDTFAHDDFPLFVMPGENVRELAAQHDGPNMTKLMEVYSLSLDLDAQLDENRAIHYE
jgi:hypothetical protein